MMEDVVYRVGMQGGEIVLVPMRGVGTIRLRELFEEATKDLIAQAINAHENTAHKKGNREGRRIQDRSDT
jgi:hypothetical protein